MPNFEVIIEKIESNAEVIGVIGLGYVGLPLAVSFAKKDVQVLGFEKSSKKVELVNTGKNYIGDIKNEDLSRVVKKQQSFLQQLIFLELKNAMRSLSAFRHRSIILRNLI